MSCDTLSNFDVGRVTIKFETAQNYPLQVLSERVCIQTFTFPIIDCEKPILSAIHNNKVSGTAGNYLLQVVFIYGMFAMNFCK